MNTKRLRIALMLDLEWAYKRHVGIFSGAQQYADEQGWESTIDESVHETLRKSGSELLPYDGIIARPTKKVAQRAKQLGVPLVNVWRSSPMRHSLPGVFPDFSAIGRLRGEHLLSRGLCNFASIIGRTSCSHELEEKAFRNTLGEEGYACSRIKITPRAITVVEKRTLARAMDNWQLPIGLFIGADNVGRLVAQMCRARGWRIPEDVAIITGENEEAICENPRPSLTSVEFGFERVGYEAARLLGSLMAGQPPPTEPILLPPVGLVVRESTDFFSVNDSLVAKALEFIAVNSHRPIGADDVAEAMATSTQTLQRRFRKYLDRSIVTEIRRTRIERAKRELSQSHRSMAEIARNVGFGRAEQMYVVFRRELDISPREYRKQRQMDGKI